MRRGALATMVLLAAAPAAAEPCASEQPEAGAPVRVALGPASFGALPEACAAHELSLRGRFDVLIDEPGFYGQLLSGAAVRGRLVLPGGSWLSADLPGVEYRFVANATVEAEGVDLSAATVGWHLPVRAGRWLQLAPYARVLLPTETVYQQASRFGVEQGVSAVVPLGSSFEVVGGYAAPLLLTDGAGHTDTLFAPALATDLGWRPLRWLTVAAGIGLRLVPAEPDEPLESLDPRAAVRLYPWRGALIDLTVAAPIAGRDRTDVAAGATLGWVAMP